MCWWLKSIVASVMLCPLLVSNAEANRLVARVDISDQTMHVFVNGETKYFWLVSTARRGYRTPIGNFKPFRMHREYYSKKYHGSPMPYSVFFHGGYAIHGTDAIKALGRPASHGCIRLDPRDAEKLYWLIKTVGHQNTHIEITR